MNPEYTFHSVAGPELHTLEIVPFADRQTPVSYSIESRQESSPHRRPQLLQLLQSVAAKEFTENQLPYGRYLLNIATKGRPICLTLPFIWGKSAPENESPDTANQAAAWLEVNDQSVILTILDNRIATTASAVALTTYDQDTIGRMLKAIFLESGFELFIVKLYGNEVTCRESLPDECFLDYARRVFRPNRKKRSSSKNQPLTLNAGNWRKRMSPARRR
jgi:hypothetical protein